MAPPSGPAPGLSGPARFQDMDLDGQASSGDRVVLTFTSSVKLGTASPSVLLLPVTQDAFGNGATLVAGPAPTEISVVLGAGASLRTRGQFSPAVTNHRSASGISLVDPLPEDSIEDAETGVDAVADGAVDIWPEPLPGIQSGLGQTAFHIDAADLNLDGQVDVVAAAGSDGVEVFESLSGGGFVSLNLPIGNAHEVLLADLSGAGRVDLLARTDSGLQALENLSTPGGWIAFSTPDTYPFPEPVSSLDQIDIDNDGDRDILAAGQTGIWVYTNQGDGTLMPPGAPISNSPPGGRDLAVGDVNRDGQEDILVALPGANSVLLNQLCSGFISTSQGVLDSTQVHLADIDRDGNLDAISSGPGPVEIWHGSTNGAFTPGTDIIVEGASSIALVDIDGDAALDLFISDAAGTAVLGGDGTGLFTLLGKTLDTGEAASICSGDVDGDGDPDLLLAAGGRPQNWSGSLAGTWGRQQMRASGADAGIGPIFSSALGDLDGNGTLDLVTGHDHKIELRYGLGNGSFNPAVVIPIPGARARQLDLGDVDHDGDLDLAAALIGEGPALWLQSGGSFIGSPIEPDGTFHTDMAVEIVELDGDLFPELVFGTVRSKPGRVYPNIGGDCDRVDQDQPYWGGYAEAYKLSTTPLHIETVGMDLDLDGDMDLVFGTGFDTVDEILLNDNGVLTPGATPFTLHGSWSLTTSDVDRDGDQDLVVATPEGHRVYLGDGLGSFEPGVTTPDTAVISVALSRMDGDAFPELLVGHAQQHGWLVIPGDSGGLYDTGLWQESNYDSIETVVVGDLDRDGAPDFITGASTQGANHGAIGIPNRIWLSR